MNRDEEKTREQLIIELKDSRQQIAEAESSIKLLMGLCEVQRDNNAVTDEKKGLLTRGQRQKGLLRLLETG